MKIFLKTEDEISLMREANRLVGQTLAELAKHIKPGVSTLQLDKIAEEFIRDHGAVPTFKDFPNPFGEPFPAHVQCRRSVRRSQTVARSYQGLAI